MSGEGDGDDPFADLDDDVAERDGDPFSEPADAEARADDPFESDESAFERMDVGDLDPDEVWERLAAAERRGSVGDERERTYAEVSKHSYCERCEFFSAPPEVACTNEGTEILAFVDSETVRIVDCPVVAERRDLE